MSDIPNCTCITCGDVAVVMDVIEADATRGLALCRSAEGDQLVDVELVGQVAVGDQVLVHAGTAIARP
jgi:hydrogenase maturation factor